MKTHKKVIAVILLAGLSLSLSSFTIAGPIEDAMAQDIADLCNDSPANELYKIANKKNNSDEMRRDALALMAEVSRECNNASNNRLTQYHQKIINVAHDVLGMTEIDSRQAALECFQYVINLPDAQQPPEGSISRGQTMANLALNDSEESIRVWALEALVTLRGNDSVVENTLISATSDSAAIVSQTANEMLNDMF